MDLSIIIPCYNADHTIGAQLDALAAQRWSGEWEVIVVDNGSTDRTREAVQAYMTHLPHLRMIDARERRGAAYARNVGVGAARGVNVAYLDADDVAQPGWLAAIGEALRDHPFVASRFEFRALNGPGHAQPPIAPQQHGLQAYTKPAFLPHAGTCGLAVRRSLHVNLGGFDESMALLEDTDYCWRLQLSGIALQFVPEAVVSVRYRRAVRRLLRQSRNWGAYNIKLYRRYRPLGMPYRPWRREWREWSKLLRRAPALLRRETRLRWLWTLHWNLGRLQGWLRFGGQRGAVGHPQLLRGAVDVAQVPGPAARDFRASAAVAGGAPLAPMAALPQQMHGKGGPSAVDTSVGR